jgi:hypothetical protein
MSSPDQQQQEQFDADDDCQYIFPQRLMSILSDERNHDAICWLPHGRGFIIRNRKLFAEKVMPRFFPRKSKYSSFTRKLNRWNFNRVSSGPELGAYYHEFFLRDKPHLAAQMFCKSARTKLAMASDIPSPLPAAMVAPQPQPHPQLQQQVVAPTQSPAARPSRLVVHQHQPHHVPTVEESMPPAARGHMVPQQTMMKPAGASSSPVVIQVVDGQGNPEPFAPHSSQRMDKAMQYLMQNQFHHFDLEPQPLHSENNHVSSGSDSSMSVSPTPIHQGAPPVVYHHHHQQPVAHHYNHGHHYHPSHNAAAAGAGQVHHHHHQQSSYGHGHGYVEHHHYQHQQMYHSAHDGGHSSSVNNADMNVWQQVEQHKQEDDRMNELRQVMAVNMQQRNHHKNSYRASAA